MTTTYPIITFEIIGGGTLEFTREQIISADIIEENKPVSIDLPISTLELSLYVSDDTFSMFEQSSYSVLAERTPILVYENVNGDARLIGKFYLDKWRNPNERKIEVTAIDIIGVLENTEFDGVFFASPTLLSEAITQVFSPINLTVDYDALFEDQYISGWIPSGTYRQALQHLCFAGNATAYTARSLNLVIASISLPNLLYETRVRDNAKINKSTELLPLVSRIEIISHNYNLSDTLTTIFEKYLEPGSYKIVFDKPYGDIAVSGSGYSQFVLGTEGEDYIGTEGGDYIEAGGEYNIGSNAVYLTVADAGIVSITGYEWIDNTYAFTFDETGTNEATNKNIIKITDATLVNLNNGQAVLDNVRDYYRQRYVQKLKLLPSEIATGDNILSTTLYSNYVLGNVHRMDLDLTGGFTAMTEIRGIVPAFALAEEHPTRRARAGLAISGAGMTRNNKWRNYA